MDSHKKILGILHLIWGTLSLLLILAFAIFFSVIIVNIPAHELDSFEFDLAKTIATIVGAFIIIVITLPSVLGGIGMLLNQKWGFILIVVSGIFSLISFPMGTAIGAYTLWAYFKEQEIIRQGEQSETFEKRPY